MDTKKTNGENRVLKESCSDINNTNTKELLNTKVQKTETKHVKYRRGKIKRTSFQNKKNRNLSNPIYNLADYNNYMNSVIGGSYPIIQEYRPPILNTWQFCAGDRCNSANAASAYRPNHAYNNLLQISWRDMNKDTLKSNNPMECTIPMRRYSLQYPSNEQSDREYHKLDVRKKGHSKLTIDSEYIIVPSGQLSKFNNTKHETIKEKTQNHPITRSLRNYSVCEKSPVEIFRIDPCTNNHVNMKYIERNLSTCFDDGNETNRNEKPYRRIRSRSESGTKLPIRNNFLKNEVENNDTDVETELASPKIIIDQKVIDASTEQILNEYRMSTRLEDLGVSSGGAGDAFKCLADDDCFDHFKVDAFKYNMSNDRTTPTANIKVDVSKFNMSNGRTTPTTNGNYQNTEKLNHKCFVIPGQGDAFKLHCYNNYNLCNESVDTSDTSPILYNSKIKPSGSPNFYRFEQYRCDRYQPINWNIGLLDNPYFYYSQNDWNEASSINEISRRLSEVSVPHFYNILELNHSANSLCNLSRSSLNNRQILSTNKSNSIGPKPHKLSLLSSEKLRNGNFIHSCSDSGKLYTQSRFSVQSERQYGHSLHKSTNVLPHEFLENFASMNLVNGKKSGHVSKSSSKTPRPLNQSFPNGFSNSESPTKTSLSLTKSERNSYSRTPPRNNRKKSHKRKPESVKYTQFV